MPYKVYADEEWYSSMLHPVEPLPRLSISPLTVCIPVIINILVISLLFLSLPLRG